MRHSVIRVFSLTLPILLTTLSCGGGGGGGGGSDPMMEIPALATIRAAPTKIDSGTRTRVTITVAEVRSEYLLVKVRYPKGLALVRDSATWEVRNESIPIQPSVAVWDDKKGAFLAFPITRGDLQDASEGRISFLLRGTQRLTDGSIDIDVDYNDIFVIDSEEFSPASPLFSTEDSVQIEVSDDEEVTGSEDDSGSEGSDTGSGDTTGSGSGAGADGTEADGTGTAGTDSGDSSS